MAEPRSEYASAGLAALLVPQANPTVEAELGVLLPPGCGAMAARLTSASPDARARLLEYFQRVEESLATLGAARPTLALFACTGSSYLVGRERERAVFAALEERRGYPVISAAEAVAAALAALGASRIALVSPYPPWLTEACVAFWRAGGIDVAQVVSLEGDRSDTRGIYALGSRDARRGWAEVRGGVQAILLSGTGMPTLGVLGQATERAPSVPVLSSNLCLAWRAALHCGFGPADLRAWTGGSAWWRRVLAARFPAACVE